MSALETAKPPSKSTHGLHLVEPTAKMLRDLPTILKQGPELEDIALFCDNVEFTWMTFCAAYTELAAAGGVVKDHQGLSLIHI